MKVITERRRCQWRRRILLIISASASASNEVRFKGQISCPQRPRACVGQHLAWAFMRIVLARLACRYDITPTAASPRGDGGGRRELGKAMMGKR